MLLNSHKLNAVVSYILNSWDNIICKFSIRRNFWLLRTHSYMSFIDLNALWIIRSFMFPFVFFFRVPKYSFKKKLFILSSKFNPCRDSINSFSISFGNTTFISGVMLYWEFSFFILFNNNRPYAEIISYTFMTITIPFIEISK